MKYILYRISTGEKLKQVRYFPDTPPDISHKDLEWRQRVAPTEPVLQNDPVPDSN